MAKVYEINNPVKDLTPLYSLRDPAVIYHEGTYYSYNTLVKYEEEGRSLKLVTLTSEDLQHWSDPMVIQDSQLNFSSPGNVFRFKDKWYLCIQSYPLDEGEMWGNDNSRLWLMESDNLIDWSEPKMIKEEGCSAKWAKTARQIDPFIMEHDGRFYCYYKTDGQIGLMISEDLENWAEADKPVMDIGCVPGNHPVENPCLIKVKDEYKMFVTYCKEGRGMCMATSKDLINWTDIVELNFQEEFYKWAPNGPSAGMVVDDPENPEGWLMFIHGEKDRNQAAAMAVLHSKDLINWTR